MKSKNPQIGFYKNTVIFIRFNLLLIFILFIIPCSSISESARKKLFQEELVNKTSILSSRTNANLTRKVDSYSECVKTNSTWYCIGRYYSTVIILVITLFVIFLIILCYFHVLYFEVFCSSNFWCKNGSSVYGGRSSPSPTDPRYTGVSNSEPIQNNIQNDVEAVRASMSDEENGSQNDLNVDHPPLYASLMSIDDREMRGSIDNSYKLNIEENEEEPPPEYSPSFTKSYLSELELSQTTQSQLRLNSLLENITLEL